jgi:peptidoglycan hydrolase-like protein with peptidoglycan-binding domain
MISKKRHIKTFTLTLFSISIIWSSQVQLITSHKKSNGTLLRLVTSSVLDLDNIAGWVGQENWFYVTLNGTYLSPSAVEYIEFEPPLLDIEITENNESVQIGYLFERPIEDFEIFHSTASRVVLIQVWESLSDSLRSEVRISEGTNENRVFSLPKQEAKGSPFYDSFVYARDKYGPEKYFVWYSNWYSTEDDSIDVDSQPSELKENVEEPIVKNDPKPLVVIRKQKIEISGPPPPKRRLLTKESIDISFILDEGMLKSGVRRPRSVKALQEALLVLGYDLGEGGVYNDGVDGDFGPNTEDAVIEFQMNRGFNTANVDGIVGEGTHKELVRALSGQKPMVISTVPENKLVTEQRFGSVIQQARETAKELLNQPPVTTQVKRETRKLSNSNEVNLLPVDLSNRKTFLKLSCNLEGAEVFIDGSLIGKTPIPKKLSVSPGWHRVRVVDPDPPPRPEFAMSIPDYQDIYVPQGRTQKIRINLAIAEEVSE